MDIPKPPPGILPDTGITALADAAFEVGEMQIARQKDAAGQLLGQDNHGGPTTAVDKESDRQLRAWLGAVRDFPVVSEESNPVERIAAMRSPGPVWMLDPLDGTEHYLKGDTRYCINIALMSAPDAGGARQPQFGWSISPA